MKAYSSISKSIFSDIVFNDCMRSGNYKQSIINYYDVMLKTKMASKDRRNYIEAKKIVSLNWSKIARFVYDIAKQVGFSIRSLIELFKNPFTVKLFTFIGWSFRDLYDILKTGHKRWNAIFKAIAEYAEEYKVVRWTADHIKKLDKYLEEHHRTKHIIGAGVAVLFIFAWFVMPYTLDIDFDFDSSEIIDGISGNFSLYDIFAGASGIKFLTMIGIGTALTVTFPWSSATAIPFIASILYTLAKKAGVKLKQIKNQMDFEDEAQELGMEFE